jgi:ATP-binding cassette, subfamily B, bacterial PglK
MDLAPKPLSSLLVRQLRLALSPRLKRAWAVLTLVMLASASLDFLSLGAVVPFLKALSSPDQLRQSWQHKFGSFIPWSLPSGDLALVTALGLVFAVLVLANALVKTGSFYLSGRVAASSGTQIARRCLAGSLYQSYAQHTLEHSGELLTRMGYIESLVGGVIQPLFQAASALLVAVAVLLAMVLYRPVATVLILLLIGLSFAVVQRYAQRRLRGNSRQMGELKVASTKLLQQTSASFRDLKLSRLEAPYLRDFAELDFRGRLLGQESFFWGGAPKMLIEGLGLAILVLSALALLPSGTTGAALIPTIGFIVLGFQKLLPAAQQMYACSTSIAGNRYAVEGVLVLLERCPAPEDLRSDPISEPLPFRDGLSFEEVCYSHGEGGHRLGPISFTIRRGEFIGLVGPTGAGKSTLVDLLMGLLQPSSGHLRIDGVPLAWDPVAQAATGAWLAQISHVPQVIYLLEGSVAENIAFGGDQSLPLDRARLDWAIGAACLQDTISRMPEGLQTRVGERGVRLSGGQRQRIGLARALYRGAGLLVLDEATSALDQATEQRVMQHLLSIPNLTIVSIAHRLTTLAQADRIFSLAADGSGLSVMSYSALV